MREELPSCCRRPSPWKRGCRPSSAPLSWGPAQCPIDDLSNVVDVIDFPTHDKMIVGQAKVRPKQDGTRVVELAARQDGLYLPQRIAVRARGYGGEVWGSGGGRSVGRGRRLTR